MNDLPWIVVHGGDIWVAALVGLTAVGAVLGVLGVVVRLAARRRAARRALGEPLGRGLREDGARVTLAGRWAGARVVSAYPARRGRGAPLASTSEGALSMVADGETVAVAGKPAVLHGDRETRPRALGRLPAETREWIIAESADATALAEAGEVALQSVDYGDRVYVGGVLRKAASAEEAKGYRRAAAVWAIVVEHAAEGHGIAYAGIPLRAPAAARAAVVGALLGLGLFGLVFLGGGRVAHRLGAQEIEAAMPLHREEALEAMADALRTTPHHDALLLEREVALARLRGKPIAAQEALLRHRQLRRAADPAEVGSSHLALMGRAAALAELGEWEAASRAIEEAKGQQGGVAIAVVHLLAGRPAIAARVLRWDAQWELARSKHEPPSSRAELAVADAIEARATSDPAAKQRLQNLVSDFPDDRAPRLLLADLCTGDERAQVLAHFVNRGSPAQAAMSLERLLGREIHQAWGRDWDRFVYPVWLVYGREEGHLWEWVPSLFEPEEALAREPYARIEAAFVASALGDHARATALLPPSPRAGDLWKDSRHADLLSHVVDRRARAAAPLPEARGAWLAGPLYAWTLTRPHGPTLAQVLDENALDADQAYIVAHDAEEGRADLSRWLRYGAFAHRSVTRLGRLAELENLRLLAVALGEDEISNELGAIVERHRRALLRREILVPLAVLEGLMLGWGVSGDL